MGARDIIFDYFSSNDDKDFESLMSYLDTDTLVEWFVDEDYVDDLFSEVETEVVMNHYELHCGR